MKILVLNAGSSSQKSCLYDLSDVLPDTAPKPIWEASIDWTHHEGFAEIKISEKFSIQPELMYSSQGASSDLGGDLKLDYINIPVMAKFYVAKSFSLEAGPQIGFLVSAKADGEDVKDFVSSTDFGFNFGAGYDFTEKLSAGLRYNLGLSNVDDSDSGDSIKNAVISITLGYKF